MAQETNATVPPDSPEAWEQHWRLYDEATQRNPAHHFRRELIFRAVANGSTAHLRILDVGCGQGDFLREARRRLPQAELAGVDFSTVGLDLARKRVPAARLHRANFETAEPLSLDLAGFATHAVCSEVLEHLDDPSMILRKIAPTLAPGAQLIVTVPGGPRSAFDIHIGHRRHYSPRDLRALLNGAGYEAVTVQGAGFPFFNLYKLMVVLRGRRLAEDLDAERPFSRASALAMAAFNPLFRLNGNGTGLGWQTFGIFRRRVDRA